MKKTVETIENFLKKNPDEKINGHFSSIIEAIKILTDDNIKVKNIKHVDKIQCTSKEILYSFMDTILYQPLTKDYIEFVKSYSKLIYNFNVNLEQDTEIDLLSQYVSKTTELIRFTKIVVEIEKKASILFQTYKNFNPPVFSLSKAILEEILKDE